MENPQIQIKKAHIQIKLNQMAAMLKKPVFYPCQFDRISRDVKRMQREIEDIQAIQALREYSDEEGEREFMRAESEYRPLTEDEKLIYSLN